MSGLPYSWSRWGTLGAAEIAEHVRRAEVTAGEVARQAREAARRVDPELCAVVELFEQPAAGFDTDVPESARQSGLLAGVPMFLKDLGSSIAGVKRENGSALHRNERVERTDPLPAAWLKHGAQFLGRAATAELGMAYDTTTVYRGLRSTLNPWNPTRTAGGSSGGSAALVAAGVVPIAHTTDGAGSTRQPAALNGLVGLKVSRGRLPLPWHVNELLNTSMVEGVVSRSLEDTALALDAATSVAPPLGKVYGAGMPWTPTQAVQALRGDPPRRLRVGVTTDAFGRSGACERERGQQVRAAAEALARDGHAVDEIAAADLPDWTILWRSFEVFWAGLRAASWRLTQGDLPAQRLEDLSPMMKGYWLAGSRYRPDDLTGYLAGNVKVTLAFGRLLERFDVLLLPVVPYATPLANTSLSPAVAQDFEAFLQGFLDAGRYTIPANEAGLPALALPAGTDTHGMPMAVQLYGRWAAEAALLQAGAALQRAFPNSPGQPAVHVSSLAR